MTIQTDNKLSTLIKPTVYHKYSYSTTTLAKKMVDFETDEWKQVENFSGEAILEKMATTKGFFLRKRKYESVSEYVARSLYNMYDPHSHSAAELGVIFNRTITSLKRKNRCKVNKK